MRVSSEGAPVVDLLCKAEVDKADVALAVEEQVLRLKVAVDHTQGVTDVLKGTDHLLVQGQG